MPPTCPPCPGRPRRRRQLLFAYSHRDSGPDKADWQSNFGLTRFDGTAEPAYIAFSDAMKRPLLR